ncbi:hypothetical protein [Pseudomonas argentinensis]|uniref:hypothetical protein n=1 Tax=Phytopseudomonas argentinensis TaxID=289370 RepID=UPI0008A8310F|nr:hypothetical protein [Pseudomonas argentinensis]
MAFSVVPYSIDNLIQCLVRGSAKAPVDRISRKLHRTYFEEYFQALSAKTIVVETGYIDRDYLEDYAAYYDRCFENYDRKTLRLHFFDIEVDEDFFGAAVTRGRDCSEEVQLRAGYLGFVVIKPLPLAVIGRTCLRTYPDDGGRRNFPCLRTYPVNLFGMELSVESLAYQEQDTVVAACATSALWSCLQGTGKLFQHPIPPPVEITNWAGEHMPENFAAASSRAFPNDGLTAGQMAYAVRRVGLEPLVIGAGTRYELNGLAYAFLKCRIPSVLVYALHEVSNKGKLVEVGQHAVAITGFSLSEDAPVLPRRGTGFQLRAAKIDKLYGHDDQVGPFARMAWPTSDEADSLAGLLSTSDEPAPSTGKHLSDEVFLKTSRAGEVYAQINFVLLPLYHKIRIPYSLIHDVALRLDSLVEKVRSNVPTVSRGEWDIYLTTSNDFKASIRNDYPKWGIDPADTLYTPLPRFMWRMLLRVGGQVELDFLFDATGIAQHDLVVHHISRGGYQDILKLIAGVSRAHGSDPSCQVAAVLEAISADEPQPMDGSLSERLVWEQAFREMKRATEQPAANDENGSQTG